VSCTAGRLTRRDSVATIAPTPDRGH
jgi:hypothetical protein